MTHLKTALVGAAFVALSGCGLVPTENTDNKPISIKADSGQYYTCSAFSMDSDSSWAGETTYTLSFHDPSRGGGKVELRGVKKLEIIEMQSMVDGPMPYPLPDIKDGLDKDGKPYQEGNIYTFPDGDEAQVKNGTWIPVKVPNTICKSGG